MIELNKIYCEDCIETLKKIDDNSIDLIVTSPPYNKNFYAPKGDRGSGVWESLKGRQIGYDIYKDEKTPNDYEEWQTEIIKECVRVLKPHGSLFYNHKDIICNGVIIPPKWVYNFKVHQQIIWDRGSSPALDPHYFFPVTEYIYWIVKDPKNVYFNKDNSVFKKNIWRIDFETGIPHPAPFPKKLVGNIIKCCSKVGDLIYDPFMGSGTTALMSVKFKRNYIGSEISQNYVDMANKRIYNETRQLELF